MGGGSSSSGAGEGVVLCHVCFRLFEGMDDIQCGAYLPLIPVTSATQYSLTLLDCLGSCSAHPLFFFTHQTSTFLDEQ